MVTVCWPGPRSLRANTTCAVCSVGLYRSTVTGTPPSMEMVAMPRSGPTVAIQVKLPVAVVNVSGFASRAVVGLVGLLSDANCTLPLYAPVRLAPLHGPEKLVEVVLSIVCTVNLAPCTQALQAVPLHERTWNW